MLERTLILIKPDAVQRRFIGEIIGRLERKGLKLVGMKLMKIDLELARRHYAVHEGKPFYEPLVQFMTSGPVVAAVLEGYRAIAVTRKLMGATFGFDAEPGTIRGDLGISNQYNLIHGSDGAETAAHEIGLFFRPEELVGYDLIDDFWNESD